MLHTEMRNGDWMVGQLNFAKAWTSGRLKVDANVFDLLKLRNFL